MFCITFLVRIYLGDPIMAFLSPRLIGERVQGCARGVASTALSTCITTPVTSAIITLLFVDADDFADTYVAALSTTMPMTMLMSYFVVGPAVKLIFHRIKPADGLRALRSMQQHAAPLLRLFGM